VLIPYSHIVMMLTQCGVLTVSSCLLLMIHQHGETVQSMSRFSFQVHEQRPGVSLRAQLTGGLSLPEGDFFQLLSNFVELILRSGEIGRVVGRLGFRVGVSASYRPSYSSLW